MIAAQTPRTIESNAMNSGGPIITSYEQSASRTTEEEFCEIVETYSDSAYNIAFRMLHDADDAEDAVQEAFISAYRAFPKFKGQSKVTTWLYRIVVNACLMKVRKEKARTKYLPEIGYDDAVIYDWRNDPQKAAINAELRDVLHNGLARLHPELRTVVVLRDVQGLSSQETAEVLDISVANAKSRLHRARVLLREYLDGYLADPVTESAYGAGS